MTLKQLAYRIIGIYRANYKNTDSLSLRLVMSWIDTTRALLTRQKLDREFGGIDEALVQSLGSLELEEIDSSIFQDIPSGRKMKRTKEKVPLPIMVRNSPGFLRVGPADRLETKFKVVNHEAALSSGYSKFNSKDIYAYYLDGHLYFISKDWNYFKQLMYVDVRGVFQNPLEAGKFTDPGFNEDSEYPIPSSMIEMIESYIVQNKLSQVMSGLSDDVANERDNLTNLQSSSE